MSAQHTTTPPPADPPLSAFAFASFFHPLRFFQSHDFLFNAFREPS